MLYQLLIQMDKLFNSSPALGLGVSFAAGVLASFSACIYPMIPITLGVIGAVASSTKLRSFLVSLVFVLGIATLYTTLGIVSSLAGVLLASFMVNPLTYLILSIIFLTLGLSECGVLKLHIPFFSVNYTQSGGQNLLSVFILGIVSGLAMIPCNFPVLFSILNLITLKKDVIYGGIALFLFSLGYGALLILLGSFTSLIRKLPKQAFWFIMVRKIIGVVLIGVGIYFLYKSAAMIYP